MACKVSVVIPAYNVEKYVRYAVQSVLNQTLTDLEVLIIDDGSSDNTAGVIEEYFSDDSRVKFLKQPQNMGVGEARNRGIREAVGEYVAFLDSDDAYLPDMLETMYEEGVKTGSDVVHATGFVLPKLKVAPDDFSTLKPEELRPVVVEDNQGLTECYYAADDFRERLEEWYNRKYHWSIWNKIYKRSMLVENEIFFDKLSMSEDMLFCFKNLCYAKKYRVIPMQPYIYRIGGAESLTRTVKSAKTIGKLVSDEIKLATALEDFMDTLEFFRNNPQDKIKVIRIALNGVDQFYLSPAMDEIGTEHIMDEGTLKGILKEAFGANSAFVEYLFYRFHELEEDTIDASDAMKDIDAFEEAADGHI